MSGAAQRVASWSFSVFHPTSVAQLGDAVPPDPLGFCALELETAGACRAGTAQPDLPFTRLQSALRLRPRRALSSDGAPQEYQPSARGQEGLSRSPVLLARPVLLTTAVRFCSHHDSLG